MNVRERFLAIMGFERPDRNLLWEMGYWSDTLERWYGEGLAHRFNEKRSAGEGLRAEASPHDEFATNRVRERDVHETLTLDKGIVCLPVNSGPEPRFEETTLEETDEYVIQQDDLGVRKKLSRTGASVPGFISWQVESRKDFEKIREERFQPVLKRRVPEQWPEIVNRHKGRDYPLSIGGYPCGFYGFLRFLMGEDRLLVNLYDDPRLVADIMSFLADFWIELWDQALREIKIDCAHFWEDMAYKTGPLISPEMFRHFMMPCYRKVTGFLKESGVKVILVDSDGNMDKLIPLFLEAGLTGIWPMEVQAGNDIVAIRKMYPQLQIMGGIDKIRISRGRESIERELESKVPFMLGAGGYIPHLDHNAHPDISWPDFCYYRKRLRELIETV